MKRTLICLLLSVLFCGFSKDSEAQQPEKWSAIEIHQAIQKCNFLGSAMYLAAHPDDENTRMISYLSNQIKARTAYLSLTRGDGGQNLIGPEIRELLGVIRTNELLMARSVDGGEQMFTRANDFGYSKHPDETLEIWEEEEVKSDVVWAIRKFRPDIIINRFDHKTAGKTHGHHTASALLSFDLFEKSGKSGVFPEHLNYYEPWSARRLFFNTSWWFYGSREKFKEADKSDMVTADVGTYYPFLGKSNTEIASESRSMHKCQGFGSTGSRGTSIEYLQLLKGDMPVDSTNLFEGINTTWTRIKGGKKVLPLMEEVEKNFDFTNPAASIPKLVEAFQVLSSLEDCNWKRVKTADLKQIIAACAGLYLEAKSSTQFSCPGAREDVEIEAINRSDVPMVLESIAFHPMEKDTLTKLSLSFNESNKISTKISIPESMNFTTPYWLQEKGSLGMYKVKNQDLIGLPETPRSLIVDFNLKIAGVPITYSKEIIYKFNDPSRGEVYRPFEIIPEVTVRSSPPVVIFPDQTPRDLKVKVKSGIENLVGKLNLTAPEGWLVQPAFHSVEIDKKGGDKTFTFSVTPPLQGQEGEVVPRFQLSEREFSNSLIEIDYDHIPFQSVMMPAGSRVVRLDIKKGVEKIGYIEGSGDVIPQSLEEIGYQVTQLDPSELSLEKLQSFDAVVLGIRVYNTVETMKFKQDILMDYVKGGGTVVAQYNTTWNRKLDQIGPYEFTISRDRVTKEEAEVRFLIPDHPLLNFPNKITQSDFENWVQERGLYFANEWSDEFEAILSSNDPGEDPKNGGLIVAKHGSGHFIYTGFSFFREFPAGVPGSFRLFSNLLSIGKYEKGKK